MKTKKMALLTMVAVSVIALSGCSSLKNLFKDFQEDWKGLTMTLRTYDEESQVIDEISGKSMSITRNTEFDSTDSDGSSNSDSKVLDITIGDNEMTHVGSSLIAAEEGLTDYFDEYSKTVNIEDMDRSTPIINRLVNNFKNEWNPKARIVLIRSQNGTPLATYVGDEVSLSSTDVPSSTQLLIDGKRLFIYRCDYTIYDLSMLEE